MNRCDDNLIHRLYIYGFIWFCVIKIQDQPHLYAILNYITYKYISQFQSIFGPDLTAECAEILNKMMKCGNFTELGGIAKHLMEISFNIRERISSKNQQFQPMKLNFIKN